MDPRARTPRLDAITRSHEFVVDASTHSLSPSLCDDVLSLSLCLSHFILMFCFPPSSSHAHTHARTIECVVGATPRFTPDTGTRAIWTLWRRPRAWRPRTAWRCPRTTTCSSSPRTSRPRRGGASPCQSRPKEHRATQTRNASEDNREDGASQDSGLQVRVSGLFVTNIDPR